MKHLLLKLSVLVLALTPAFASYADPGISFDGPKITDRGQFGGKERGMTFPGDFSVYPFAGSPHVDAAVPQIRLLWGFENKNNWPSATPNTYFNGVGLSNGSINLVAVQGQFDGDGGGLKDVVVLDTGGLKVCYNFNGSACAGESGDVPVTVGLDKPLTLWSARVADFNGDGKDDVAVVGFDYNSFDGYVAVVAGNNAGGSNPFNPDAGDPNLASPYYKQMIKCGIPLAVTVGQFGGDAKPDLAVSTFNRCNNTAGASVHAFLNTGGSFDFKQDAAAFKRNDCDKPTGLATYNPDGNAQDDLVLTCYDKFYSNCPPVDVKADVAVENPPVIACVAGWKSGPVMALQNNGSGSGFGVKQTLGDTDETSLKFPYTSTTGDYDGDGNQDLAVASNGGSAVVTYAGTSPFQVNPDSRNDISTLSYTPKFIQTHDMNGDGLPDLILTAAAAKFPEQRIPDTEITHVDFLDRYTVARAPVEYVPGKYYTTAEPAYRDTPLTLNNDAVLAARGFVKASPTEYKINYTPNSFQKGSQVLVLNDNFKYDGTYERLPGDFGARVPASTDGLLVLINHRPTVSGDDPKCDGGEVTYRCTASEGNTITECTPATTDPAVTFTPAVPGPGNKEWSGKVKLPKDQGVHKWTVTAKDNLGTVTTGEFTADYSNCPGGSTACPATPIEKQLSPKDPVMICAFENDQKLAELNGGKTVTWAQVGSKGIDLSALSVQGQCLVGPRLPLSFDQDRVIELKYSVEPDGPKDCPAKFVFPKAFFEGSGSLFGCSLNAAPGLASAWSLWALGWLPAAGLWVLARRFGKK